MFNKIIFLLMCLEYFLLYYIFFVSIYFLYYEVCLNGTVLSHYEKSPKTCSPTQNKRLLLGRVAQY